MLRFQMDPLGGMLGGGAAGPPPSIDVPHGVHPDAPTMPIAMPGEEGQGGQGGIPGQPDSPDAEQAIKSAVDALHAAIGLEEDDQDKALLTKALVQVQTLLGGRQKQQEAAMGTTPAHKAITRATRRAAPTGPGY